MTRAEGTDRSLSEFISRNAYKEAQSQPALVHRSYHTYPYILRTTRRLCAAIEFMYRVVESWVAWLLRPGPGPQSLKDFDLLVHREPCNRLFWLARARMSQKKWLLSSPRLKNSEILYIFPVCLIPVPTLSAA